mmetsp:Transcript_9668/g.18485  ORF Transcript_9668/g.18485 Transcript_9668/m.18485 type:complete len:87 (-) Transcript_9668:246-506(-)|eukprot:scaffold4226_cov180-Amphora_coffeaeformis.AAC.11
MGTWEGGNQITIVEKPNEHEYAATTLVAKLSAGDQLLEQPVFFGSLALTIRVDTIDTATGRATVTVIMGDDTDSQGILSVFGQFSV